MNKFWNWVRNEDTGAAELIFNGPISEDTWFGDEITPAMFRNELSKVSGDLTVWLNSPGGDVFAASQIYTMLRSHKGKVTVKIDGIAASAASVIAMGGDRILMSPVSMLMIHNPATGAFGDHAEMLKAIDMLAAVKESIINAYVTRTGMSRAKLSHLMDAETWMDANAALEMGFIDDIIKRDKSAETDEDADEPDKEAAVKAVIFSRTAVNNALMNKMEAKFGTPKPTQQEQAKIDAPAETGRKADEIRDRLNVIKRFI